MTTLPTMRNPSRTLQNSIFEPLFAREEAELHFQPNTPIQSASSDWRLPHSLSSPFSCAPPATSHKANMRRAPATIFINDDTSEDSSSDKASHCARQRESITSDHAILGMHSPYSGSSSTVPTSAPSCPPSRSHSSSDVIDYDDGSVASKLLASITKSISSPSLLACCKESARETPYQKTLRLRKMKLQHCAEELGSESSDGSLHDGDYNNIFDSLSTMSSFRRSSQSTREFSEAHQNSEGNASSHVMISVRSSPNLRCTSLVTKHTSQIKERSFPPPLTYSLPRSTSSDSFSSSLCAYRADGRFVLKEVKVPCRQYFQSSRKDGRLTLQLFTTDEDFESKQSEVADRECTGLQEVDNISAHQVTINVTPEKAKGGSCDKIEVESANTGNLIGEVEVCRLTESKKIDHVGVDNAGEENNVECLSAKSLLMATLSNGNCGSSKYDKVKFISSDFKAADEHKAGKASSMRLMSNQRLLSTSWKLQSPIHPPGKSPKLKLGHDCDVTKFSQCEESLGLESKSTRGVSNGGGKTLLQGFEITSASLQKSGYGVGESASSTIIFKDVSAKCLMENMSKLVASFGLEGGKWSCGEELKSRALVDNNSDGVMESSMYKGIKSINIGVRQIENGSHKAISGVSFDVKCERRSFRCGTVIEGNYVDGARSCHPSSSFHFDVQIPSSTNNQAAFQGKEWLHTLHCKEVLYRNQLAKGFMKLHCVA